MNLINQTCDNVCLPPPLVRGLVQAINNFPLSRCFLANRSGVVFSCCQAIEAKGKHAFHVRSPLNRFGIVPRAHCVRDPAAAGENRVAI